MAFVPVPNTAKVTLEFTWGGQTVVLTLYWKKGSALDATDLTGLLDGHETWVTDELAPTMTGEISFNRMTAVDLTSSTGIFAERIISPAVTGSVSGSTTNNAALVVGFLTALRGRSFRGRNYVPGIAPIQLASSTDVTPTKLSITLLAYNALSDIATATGLEHVVVSRFSGGAPRVTGLATPVTGYYGDTAVDSQRRRLRLRGV